LFRDHTESDPAALVSDFLVLMGNMIGRQPHALHEDTRHGCAFNVAQVGKTARGRKGTALQRVLSQCRLVDPDWAERCLASGLSSGEGILWAIRDPIVKRVPIKKQ